MSFYPDDVLSALEGLKEELRLTRRDVRLTEDDRNFITLQLERIDKWFPFAHQIKTAEFDKGCEEFHKEWDEAGKEEGTR
jgi:hypothetical protein